MLVILEISSHLCYPEKIVPAQSYDKDCLVCGWVLIHPGLSIDGWAVVDNKGWGTPKNETG